ncbi:DUF4326 domain-containing protein [Chelativorans sp. AA-79]|uniref:DUF4326 domain-containing protein n=1 Tax=Chelativorans sp. AA-79 TaxID=3028735 RepID=UPI0023F92F7D|nr:DUF4326 domain-containing protein [Chelativorans sp. AA-79]WEX10341.1 DUF4326 domain-containing protein [Chelativorans sp. AA-79]
MVEPVRLQLSRTKGFKLQEHSREVNGLPAIKVDRSTGYGNPWSIRKGAWWFVDGPNTPIGGIRCGNEEGARVIAVKLYREEAERLGVSSFLRGKNLACWCPAGAPCHADVLLELANRPICEEVS